MTGLTNEGLTIPRLVDIIDDLKVEATSIFQDLVPEGDVVNTGDNSVIGRQIGLISPSLADLWEAIQQVNDAFNINAATGIPLDNLVALGGVQRQPAASTITTVLLTGDVGVEIPLGTQVQSSNNGKFHNLLETVVLNASAAYSITATLLSVANSTAYSISYQKNPDTEGDGVVDVSITSDGSATEAEILAALAAAINGAPHNTLLSATVDGSDLIVQSLEVTQKFDFTSSANINIEKVSKASTVSCDETGSLEQPIGTVTRIAVPISGWDSVTNPLVGIPGGDRETDAELRERYKLAKFGDGQNLIESLYSALYAVDGVESVIIIENDTNSTLAGPGPAVPAHSFYVVVLGGASQEIGNAIWQNKPAGILSWGVTTVQVYDSQEVAHTVQFDRPTSVPIYVEVEITVQSNFAPDGVAQMKEAIADHINALLIGEDVLYSRLYSPINSIVGHYVNNLFIAKTPTPVATANITVAYNEKAVVTADNINIVTV